MLVTLINYNKCKYISNKCKTIGECNNILTLVLNYTQYLNQLISWQKIIKFADKYVPELYSKIVSLISSQDPEFYDPYDILMKYQLAEKRYYIDPYFLKEGLHDLNGEYLTYIFKNVSTTENIVCKG